jgi:hypothetical protein
MADATTDFVLPTKSEIDALKKKHGKLFQIAVKKDGKDYFAILRKPKIVDLQVASASEKKKAFTFNASIWANCKLVSDPAIDGDDDLLMGAYSQIDEIIETAEASIKEL